MTPEEHEQHHAARILEASRRAAVAGARKGDVPPPKPAKPYRPKVPACPHTGWARTILRSDGRRFLTAREAAAASGLASHSSVLAAMRLGCVTVSGYRFYCPDCLLDHARRIEARRAAATSKSLKPQRERKAA